MPEWTSPLYTQAQIIGYLLDLVDELDARWTLNQRPVMWTWDIPNWYILYSMERNGQNKTYAAWVCAGIHTSHARPGSGWVGGTQAYEPHGGAVRCLGGGLCHR